VQDSISAKLAGALTLQITSSDRAHAARQATQNTAAYEAYLMGLYFWNSGGDGLAKAIPYFQRAVELDSNFTLAIAYLADCYYFNAAINYGIVPVEESRQKAHAYVAQALAIDESVAEAHMALAGLKTLEEDYAGAKTEFERTLTLNPNIALAHNRYGVFLFHMSDLDGAVRELRRGQELDPVSRLTNRAGQDRLGHRLRCCGAHGGSAQGAARATTGEGTAPPLLLRDRLRRARRHRSGIRGAKQRSTHPFPAHDAQVRPVPRPAQIRPTLKRPAPTHTAWLSGLLSFA
jgi:tetratricopeptide (TPR) repeat protein